MTKRAGDTSDKITELRKELETLRSERDALRREVRILRPTNNSSTSRRTSTHIVPSPSVRRVQGDREPSRPDILTREDRERTATVSGRRYIYRNGKPLELSDRQIGTLSQKRFMAETAASSGRRRFEGEQTFDFLRRRDNGRPKTPGSTVDFSWAESRPQTPTDNENQSSVFDHLPAHAVDDSGERTSEPPLEGPELTANGASGVQADKQLGDDLEISLGLMKIHSRRPKEILDRALVLMQSVLWERARAHWPNLFKDVDQGEYLVLMCGDEMSDNLALMNISEVCPNPRDGRRLWRLLRHDLPRVRNRMAHKKKEYLCDTRLVELDLKDLQEAIYLLGDPERAAEIRQLRDQVKEEAEKAWNTLTDLHNRIQLPGFEVQDQDMEYMHALDQVFAEIIRSEMGLSSMPITVREAMVQVAEYYIQQLNIGKFCTELVHSEAYAWKRYDPSQNF